jgi:hypothetical protein
MCRNIPTSHFEETPTHTRIKINRLEEGHNSYPLVCRRPAETVALQRRQICYRWGTTAYWSLVPRSSTFYLFEFCLKNMWNCSLLNCKTLLIRLCSSSSIAHISSNVHINLLLTIMSVYHPTSWQIKNPLRRNHSQNFKLVCNKHVISVIIL